MFKKIHVLFAFIVLLFATSYVMAEAKSELSWKPPTERVDGTPMTLEEIKEFRIYYEVDGPITSDSSVIVAASTSTKEIITLFLDPRAEPYTVNFAISTVDTMDRESKLSETVSEDFNLDSTSPPNSPAGLQINITCGEGCTIQINPAQ